MEIIWWSYLLLDCVSILVFCWLIPSPIPCASSLDSTHTSSPWFIDPATMLTLPAYTINWVLVFRSYRQAAVDIPRLWIMWGPDVLKSLFRLWPRRYLVYIRICHSVLVMVSCVSLTNLMWHHHFVQYFPIDAILCLEEIYKNLIIFWQTIKMYAIPTYVRKYWHRKNCQECMYNSLNFN